MIVFFLPNLGAGGAERVMLNLLLAYQRNYPHTELVLLLFKKEGLLLNDVPNGVSIHELNTSGASKSVLSFVSFCKKNKPKIVFSSLGPCLTTSLAKPFISKDIIIINRIGSIIGAEKLSYKNAFMQFLYLFANKIVAKMSNHIIFQCYYMADDFVKETKIRPKHFSVIFNPVKINHIQKLSKEKIDKNYTFVAVGRLAPPKDYTNLIRACGLLKVRNAEFTLAIVGKGSLHQSLETLIEELGLQEHVFLLGHKSNPYAYMSKANYLVSSSLYEGFSNVIIESLCLGTPVIATNCPGGNAEVIHDGKNGWLCQVQNSEDLAVVMEKSLHLSVEFDKQKIAQNAIAIFDAEIIFKQYEKVLNQYLL